MRIDNNTVLITGGSSGIGLALAQQFVDAGNTVIICGRRKQKLDDAREAHPELHTRVCDISVKEQREELFTWVTTEFPTVNIIVNNAGIQRETSFLEGAPQLYDGESEIETNLTGTIHLCALFVPHLAASGKESAIINVTSGLAFIPLKIAPVYCATKAALHSFSMTLRSQLAETAVRVFEIIPPIVKTDLHRGAAAKKQGERGIPPGRVATKTIEALQKDRYEKSVGQGGDLKFASKIAPHFFH
jgi:uncharacterized oxidoreductase